MKKYKDTPLNRFPGFTKPWVAETASWYFPQIRNGFVGVATPHYRLFGVPYLQGKNIQDGAIDEAGLIHVSEEFHREQVKSQLKTEDLLMVQSGHVGECAVVTDAFSGSNCHALIVMTPDKERADSRFFCNYFYSPSGLKQIYSITTGNTIQHVLASDVKELRIYAPEVGEQRKLSEFFSAINEKIRQIATQKALWVRIKSAFVQSLHNGVVSFNSRKDESFRSWKMTKLSDVLFEHKLTSIGSEEVYSVSVHKGLINQVEHLGRSFSAATTDHYNLVQPGDVVYTKSPTGEFPFGIIKQSKVESNVIVSPLYGVFTPQTKWLGHWLNAYFESAVNTSNYLKPLIQKGAKNTINITNERFLSNSLMLPVDHEEQRKISAALGAIEKKIEIVERQHQLMVSFKKGLLQKLFV